MCRILPWLVLIINLAKYRIILEEVLKKGFFKIRLSCGRVSVGNSLNYVNRCGKTQPSVGGIIPWVWFLNCLRVEKRIRAASMQVFIASLLLL